MAMSKSFGQQPSQSSLAEARDEVVGISMDVFERTGSVEAGHLVISALLSSGDPLESARALPVAFAVSELDPVGLWSQRHLADVLWETGQQQKAMAMYERVLEIDSAREIDSMRRLNDFDRAQVEQRLIKKPKKP